MDGYFGDRPTAPPRDPASEAAIEALTSRGWTRFPTSSGRCLTLLENGAVVSTACSLEASDASIRAASDDGELWQDFAEIQKSGGDGFFLASRAWPLCIRPTAFVDASLTTGIDSIYGSISGSPIYGGVTYGFDVFECPTADTVSDACHAPLEAHACGCVNCQRGTADSETTPRHVTAQIESERAQCNSIWVGEDVSLKSDGRSCEDKTFCQTCDRSFLREWDGGLQIFADNQPKGPAVTCLDVGLSMEWTSGSYLPVSNVTEFWMLEFGDCLPR